MAVWFYSIDYWIALGMRIFLSTPFYACFVEMIAPVWICRQRDVEGRSGGQGGYNSEYSGRNRGYGGGPREYRGGSRGGYRGGIRNDYAGEQSGEHYGRRQFDRHSGNEQTYVAGGQRCGAPRVFWFWDRLASGFCPWSVLYVDFAIICIASSDLVAHSRTATFWLVYVKSLWVVCLIVDWLIDWF